MTALYDVGQQKTTECGAGLSLTKTFRLLTNCAVVDFVGGCAVAWHGVLGRRISGGGDGHRAVCGPAADGHALLAVSCGTVNDAGHGYRVEQPAADRPLHRFPGSATVGAFGALRPAAEP